MHPPDRQPWATIEYLADAPMLMHYQVVVSQRRGNPACSVPFVIAYAYAATERTARRRARRMLRRAVRQSARQAEHGTITITPDSVQ